LLAVVVSPCGFVVFRDSHVCEIDVGDSCVCNIEDDDCCLDEIGNENMSSIEKTVAFSSIFSSL
jgi:hypothetical protein